MQHLSSTPQLARHTNLHKSTIQPTYTYTARQQLLLTSDAVCDMRTAGPAPADTLPLSDKGNVHGQLLRLFDNVGTVLVGEQS